MAMLEIGSVVRAAITRIEPFGVFLIHDNDSIIVMAPDVAWKPLDFHSAFKPGQIVGVLILRRNDVTGEWVGSIRQLDIEGNPYRPFASLSPDTVVPGVVVRRRPGYYDIEIGGGAQGLLKTDREFRAGDRVAVTIARLSVDDGELELELA